MAHRTCKSFENSISRHSSTTKVILIEDGKISPCFYKQLSVKQFNSTLICTSLVQIQLSFPKASSLKNCSAQ
jgi:hypothetical protein